MEGDHSSLVQGLRAQGQEAANGFGAKDCREKGHPPDILGSEYDKISRSLLAALERMKVEETRRCSQALLCRLGILPSEAQELVAGLVAYGADVDAEPPRNLLTSMDSCFLTHWWGMASPHLTPLVALADAVTENSGTAVVGVLEANDENGHGCKDAEHSLQRRQQ